ncbi:hypothetical protein GTV15_16935 [Streptomyces sp. SID7803]|nr:hypothetical protein [Streptomyces sp. SID7803]
MDTSAESSRRGGPFTCRTGDEEHDRVLPHIAPRSTCWATDAGLLVVALPRRHVDALAQATVICPNKPVTITLAR